MTNKGGDADLELDPADLVPQLHANLGVQGRQGLVEQQHLRLDRQRPGQRDALLLAAGHLVGIAIRVIVEADQLQVFHRPLVAGAGILSAQLQTERHVVPGGHVREEGVRLEDHAHVPLRRGHRGDVPAPDHHLAAVCVLQTGEHAQRGCLAAAGRTEQHHQLAGGHVEAHTVERVHVTESSPQVAQFNPYTGLCRPRAVVHPV